MHIKSGLILKQLIKFIILSITDFLSCIGQPKKIKLKSILLVRLDAIGDYVLWRNFIEILKESKKYRNYKIILVGNEVWKDLAVELDGRFIDNFIWVNRKKFEKNPFYRLKKLREVVKQGYEIVINPTYSRSFFADDSIVKVVTAKEKIGSRGDLSNIKKWQKKISDKYYDILLPAKNEIMFEFCRNKEFFETLLGEELRIKKPQIRLNLRKTKINLPRKYAVLFIGAGHKLRKWGVRNFVQIAKYLHDHCGYKIVLCGGISDLCDAKKFANYYKGDYLDLVGKVSLVDLLYVIRKGDLMISNETAAPHLGVAVGAKMIFVIYNGNHFGRFIPYPREMAPDYYPIYHPEIERNISNYKKLSNSYGYGSKLDINEISPEQVIKALNRCLEVETGDR